MENQRSFGISTEWLKVVACVCMVVDHVPYLMEGVWPEYYEFPVFLMHGAGRVTAMVFFYLLALGYARTRDAGRYVLRLAVFALLSYVPYIWYFEGSLPNNDNFYHLNVVFTMLTGLLLLRALHEVRGICLRTLCVAGCFAVGYFCDYGLYGLALILVCDLGVRRRSRATVVLGMAAVILVYVWVNMGAVLGRDAGPFDVLGQLGDSRVMAYFVVMVCQLVPLGLIWVHRIWIGENGTLREGRAAGTWSGFWGKWGFYVFYPAHLFALVWVRGVAGG